MLQIGRLISTVLSVFRNGKQKTRAEVDEKLIDAAKVLDHYELAKTSVAFIYSSEQNPCSAEDNTGPVRASGTGFFVGFSLFDGEERVKDGRRWIALFTNKHVLQEVKNQFVSDVIVRINAIGNTSAKCIVLKLESEGQEKNVIGHPDDLVDLAAILMPKIDDCEPVTFDPSMLLKKAQRETIKLNEGFPVFTVGYRDGYAGHDKNRPMLLFGKLNLVTHENWLVSARGGFLERERAYIAQLNVTGGASGSPVLLDPHAIRLVGEEIQRWPGGPKIIGVVKTGRADLEKGGSGLASIEPGECAYELAIEIANLLLSKGFKTKSLSD